MSRPLYLTAMAPFDINTTLIAQDAAEALIALGWKVTRPTLNRPTWSINSEAVTVTELLVIAAFACIIPPHQSTE